jgi:hypothetical protein
MAVHVATVNGLSKESLNSDDEENTHNHNLNSNEYDEENEVLLMDQNTNDDSANDNQFSMLDKRLKTVFIDASELSSDEDDNESDIFNDAEDKLLNNENIEKKSIVLNEKTNNYQNLTINKVNSFADLHSRRISLSNFHANNAPLSNGDTNQDKLLNENQKYENQLMRSRSRSASYLSSSSSSLTFSSPQIKPYSTPTKTVTLPISVGSEYNSISSLNYEKIVPVKKTYSSFYNSNKSFKKMKLSILTLNNNLTNNASTATNNANPNIDLKESKIKSLHRKFIKSSTANENKLRKNMKKRVKKFSKLNEENRISSAYSISNFSSISYTNSNVKKLKCLLVGDPLVGKTTLICLFLKRLFQTDYQPTIVDNYEGFYPHLLHNAYLF